MATVVAVLSVIWACVPLAGMAGTVTPARLGLQTCSGSVTVPVAGENETASQVQTRKVSCAVAKRVIRRFLQKMATQPGCRKAAAAEPPPQPGCVVSGYACFLNLGGPYCATGDGREIDWTLTETRPRILNYVALGDSYSSGHGVPPYDPATNVRSGPKRDICHRSKYAYSRVLEIPHFRLKRSFFACSGATTKDVTSIKQYPGETGDQLSHTKALRAADLVTITIGGNDVRFDQVLKNCIRGSHSCNHKAILDRARNLEPKLISTYAAIRAAVPSTAAVLVLDYPQLFPKHGLPNQCQPDELLFTRSTQRFLRRAASLLRTTIADAARRAGVQFVDVMPIFAGHEICGPDGGWINHILLVPKPGSSPPVGPGENVAHPNRAGQAAYARAISNYIRARITARAPLTPAGLPADPPPQD